MSKIDDLINKIQDEELQNRIREEVRKLKKQKKFGLVYEEHLPEATLLYDVPIKQGSTVVKRDGNINDVYYVSNVKDDILHCIRMDKTKEEMCFNRKDMVTVSQFGQPIFPFVKPIDIICNNPDSDLWHILIESDNYHALQLLVYLYGGKVNCIYIDPPYNTGAKDWKYNNDYVDGADSYRHSKWLSFMERRLKLAKKLLNPKDGVLIVAIDEKEYLRLGLLLEQIFLGNDIQMITTVMNAKGAVREGKFSRVEEYLFVVTIGEARVHPLQYNMLDTTSDDISNEPTDVEWLGFRRRERTSVRSARPNQFYPIFVENQTGRISKIGDRIDLNVPRSSITVPDGCTALWPLKPNGTEMLWGLTPNIARNNLKKGYLRVNNWNKNTKKGTVQYLQRGVIEGIENGDIVVVGHREDGSVIAQYNVGANTKSPKRVWNVPSHNAEMYGTKIVSDILGNGRFNFPKSIYAVKDILAFYIKDNPSAIVVDFFAGSGTTLHAVNLLNAEYGGHRKCIMITNNEVSNDEANNLIEQGYNQGDDEWEKIGIAHYVTWPRTVCSIKGEDINGNPLQGTYLGTEKPMSEGFETNAIFFKLGFLDKNEVALGRNLKELLPLLWMKNDAIGECPSLNNDDVPEMLILPKNKMAILIDEDCYPKFREEVNSNKDIKTVFILSNSEDGYREMISRLNVKQTYQLYRDYLDNFTLNNQ